MPSCANIEKYVMTEEAKATFPFPSAPRVLVIYGSDISGNTNDDILRIIFIAKLYFTLLIFMLCCKCSIPF